MKHMQRLSAIVLFIAVAMPGLAACGASKALKEEDRRLVQKVYVDPNVLLPPQPAVNTRGGAIGNAIGGLIGESIKAGAATDEGAVLEYLQSNKINIGEMLASSFAAELQEQRLFQLATSASDADAVFSLEIVRYGISHNGNAFSNQYRTYMRAKGALKRSDGTLLWTEELGDGPMNGDRPQTTLEDLFGNPETMREHMRLLAHVVASELAALLASTGAGAASR
jgi:hypothetical protein